MEQEYGKSDFPDTEFLLGIRPEDLYTLNDNQLTQLIDYLRDRIALINQEQKRSVWKAGKKIDPDLDADMDLMIKKLAVARQLLEERK